MSEVTVKLSNSDIEAISESVAFKLKKHLNTTPEVHNITAVAKILKCHRNTVINHIERGLLKGTRKGRSWYVQDQDLRNYINGI